MVEEVKRVKVEFLAALAAWGQEIGLTMHLLAPTVSLVVVTMNRRAQLIECLENLRQQDYPHLEIIVVDNNSSDGTGLEVRDRFPNMRLLSLPKNLGVSGGRNQGIQAAQGEICICIDDDAVLEDRSAARRVANMFAANPRLACLGFTILQATTMTEDRKSLPRADKKVIPEDYPASYFCGAGFALRRAAFQEAGMFWESLMYGGEELDLCYRLLDRGHEILHTRQVVVRHFETPGGRPTGQWVYFNARNRSWVAARNLPWRYVVTTSFLWWLYTAVVAVQRRTPASFCRGLIDSLAGMPTAVRNRRCIQRKTVRLLRELSGRLAY